MITHYDLFAGIGGFSIAVDEVWGEPVRHIFCEWEAFPTQVLKKHWPNGEFWGDIADLVAHTRHQRQAKSKEQAMGGQESCRIVTGGFPCQPFSQAGQRRGTADDRYKWPEMFEVIRNVTPDWVIAENVAGLVSWSEGMVLEQVCADLEGEGYEVWPLVIPAVAVNAPHRRDRVWIVANRGRIGQKEQEQQTTGSKQFSSDDPNPQSEFGKRPKPERGRRRQPETEIRNGDSDVADPERQGQQKSEHSRITKNKTKARAGMDNRLERQDWSKNWLEVATELCSLDDGLPARMGDTTISRARHRQEQLKAYGNAIVPAVAVEILKAIKESL